MAGTQYGYADNLEWKRHPILNGPCIIQVQYGDVGLVHFGQMGIDGIISGMTIATDITLSSTILTGVAYINDTSITTVDTLHAFTALKDTYVDVTTAGAFVYTEVAVGATVPVLTYPNQRIAKVTTSDTAVITVTDLRSITTVNNPLTYEGIRHQHFFQKDEPFRYTGNEAIWIRTFANNVAGIYQRAKIVCSPLVNV